MIIPFSKYHGAGNDFIMIDNTVSVFTGFLKNQEVIAHLCHRRFGIGADGLIVINKSADADFEMIYYNSDGKEGSMCGNGGRCIMAFANKLGLAGSKAVFNSSDGLHQAEIISSDKSTSVIKLHMKDVTNIKSCKDHFIIDTGSPHYISFTKNVSAMDVFQKGKEIRNSDEFREKGINVNFAEIFSDHIFVRTYERGVEDETLSCGTGSTAAAIAANEMNLLKKGYCSIKTKGGDLKVYFSKTAAKYSDIWLEGPAVHVFEGRIDI